MQGQDRGGQHPEGPAAPSLVSFYAYSKNKQDEHLNKYISIYIYRERERHCRHDTDTKSHIAGPISEEMSIERKIGRSPDNKAHHPGSFWVFSAVSTSEPW